MSDLMPSDPYAKALARARHDLEAAHVALDAAQAEVDRLREAEQRIKAIAERHQRFVEHVMAQPGPLVLHVEPHA